MRAWSPAEVLAQSSALIPKMRALTAPRLLRPIRDGWIVPTDDRVAYRAGRFHPVPTLVGSNADEGSRLTAGWPVADVTGYRALIATNFGAHAAEALRHYGAERDADVAAALAAVFGDTQFSYGARGIAATVSARQPATYRYLYTCRAEGAADGPHHGEEVAGLFGGSTAVGRRMADAWVRFAASGDPNGGDLPAWPPATPHGDEALEFGATVRPLCGWRASTLDFLDRFYG
jgi:para-nitrobenzyl esterase